MEEETLRPSPSREMAEMRTGTRLPAWSMMCLHMVPVAVEYLLVPVGHDVVRLLQLFVAPHAFTRSWHQLLVYQVVRRAAVHNHREPVAVGVKTSVAATS